jgi:hypothetical protein
VVMFTDLHLLCYSRTLVQVSTWPAYFERIGVWLSPQETTAQLRNSIRRSAAKGYTKTQGKQLTYSTLCNVSHYCYTAAVLLLLSWRY